MKNLKIFLIFVLFLNSQITLSMPLSLNIDFFDRFNDEFLYCYIIQAIQNNHNLKAANKKVEQYRWEIKNSFSQELPKLSVSSNYLGAHFPKGDGNFLLKQNSYVLPFQASYEPDLLLKNRDKTRSYKKLYTAQIANQKSTYISLLSDVATSYINILLTDYLIEQQSKILEDKIQNVKLNKSKFDRGVIDLLSYNDSREELKTQETIYDNLLKTRKTMLYNFCLLIGQSANNWQEIKRGRIETFEYKGTIPDCINSDLIYERPDLIEIENKLKSAKIDVTVAKKEFFPSFNITGYYIFDTAGRGNFFSWESSFAFLLAGLTQDIFAGGRKIANLKIKKARFEELFEQYKQADLNAIKEINNALNLIKFDKLTEKNTKYQLDLEKINFNRSQKKLKRGVISKGDYLSDKISLEQKKQLFVSSKAMRLVNYITLYKAVGGQL